jgi:hypothetical protein
MPCTELDPKPSFCDDFERASAGAGWAAVKQVRGGAATIVADEARSPTRCLSCTTPASDGGTSETAPAAVLERSFPVVSEMWITFDWKIGAAPTVGQLEIHELWLRSALASDPLSLQFDVRRDRAAVVEGHNGVYADHALKRSPAFGRWERVRVHLVLVEQARLTVQFGDDVVLDETFTVTPTIGPSQVDLNFGIVYSLGSEDTVHLDNVLVDWR